MRRALGLALAIAGERGYGTQCTTILLNVRNVGLSRLYRKGVRCAGHKREKLLTLDIGDAFGTVAANGTRSRSEGTSKDDESGQLHDDLWI